MQQQVHKVVGRFPANTNPLIRLEEMIAFLKKVAPEALANREGDYYPVRKVVGRPVKSRSSCPAAKNSSFLRSFVVNLPTT